MTLAIKQRVEVGMGVLCASKEVTKNSGDEPQQEVEQVARVNQHDASANEKLLLELLPVLFREMCSYLPISDVVRMRLVSKRWRESVKGYGLRLDEHFAPMTPGRWKKHLKKKSLWNIEGIRLLDAVPGDKMYKVIVPRRIKFLQLSCLRVSGDVQLDLSKFTNLEHLEIDELRSLKDLESLRVCKTLKGLTIRRCDNLCDVSCLGVLSKLESIEIQDCRLVEDISQLALCSKLRKAIFSGLERVVEIGGPMSLCMSLTDLTVSRCRLVSNLDGIERLGLEQLVLRQLPAFGDAPRNLHQCTTLHTLVISSCPLLKNVDGLDGCVSLRRLDLSITLVSNLEPLETCTNLEFLDLALCHRLKGLESLKHLTQLRAVSLWRCLKIRSLNPLVNCPSLEWVDVTSVPNCSLAPLGHIRTVINDGGIRVNSHRQHLVQ